MSRRTHLYLLAATALTLAGCGDDKKSTTSTDTEPMTSSAATSSAATSAATEPMSSSAATSSGTGGSGTGGSGTGGTCGCDNPEHICCAGKCVDPRNDRNNCGRCGTVCAEPTPYCGAGACATPPCDTTCTDSKACCGASCCAADTICCQIDGPVQSGPSCVPPTAEGSCPPSCSPLCVCAAPNTPISTPTGDRPIAELRPGDLVYSVHGEQIVAVPIVQVRRTPVVDHRVVRAVLDDGSVLEISAAHPLGDRRTFADLRAGDRLDGRGLREVAMVPYAYPATHDILPASDTGTYFVRGVLVGSTLGPTPRASASR